MRSPLVSVVTPFHNAAPYLAQCIKSVLLQSYSDFEYILVDNRSTDTSGDIAREFARRDSRIRLIHRAELLSQVDNYNGALNEISPASEFCKIVQADDWIFPECLRLMVQSFEQSPKVGLVSSYWLKGRNLWGAGLSQDDTLFSGREVARLFLFKGIYVFGSPTTVMYRSSLIRRSNSFYDVSRLHEDTEKCMEILKDWDFGFVHQVLSFLRTDNESISSRSRSFRPELLDKYIIDRRYSTAFLDSAEAAGVEEMSKRNYYRMLSHQALRLRKPAFWRYHVNGLRTIAESINAPLLCAHIARELLWMMVNPGVAVRNVIYSWTNRQGAVSRVSESNGAPLTKSDADSAIAGSNFTETLSNPGPHANG